MGFACRVLYSKDTCDQVGKCEGWFPQKKDLKKGCKRAARQGQRFDSREDYMEYAGISKKAVEEQQREAKESRQKAMYAILGIGLLVIIIIAILIIKRSSK